MQHTATRRRRTPLPASPEPEPKSATITEEDVRRRAFEIYVERGNTPGDEIDDWLRAEMELKGK